MAPLRSHFPIRLLSRRSPLRSPSNRSIQSLSIRSKNLAMAASRIQLSLRFSIPYAKASSASCAPRPGRNPSLNPRNSASYIGVRRLSTTAF